MIRRELLIGGIRSGLPRYYLLERIVSWRTVFSSLDRVMLPRVRVVLEYLTCGLFLSRWMLVSLVVVQLRLSRVVNWWIARWLVSILRLWYLAELWAVWKPCFESLPREFILMVRADWMSYVFAFIRMLLNIDLILRFLILVWPIILVLIALFTWYSINRSYFRRYGIRTNLKAHASVTIVIGLVWLLSKRRRNRSQRVSLYWC